MAEKTDKELKEVPKISMFGFVGIDGKREPVSISDFLDWAQSKKKIAFEMVPEAFYKFENEGITNAQRIIDQYNDVEKVKYKDEIAQNQPPVIKPGTNVFLPNISIKIDITSIFMDALLTEERNNVILNRTYIRKIKREVKDGNFI